MIILNPNAPQKGSEIKVDPIKNLEDINLIKRMLKDNLRDLAIFTIGINTNLRASDLVRLETQQVKYLSAGENFEIKEKKTKKQKRITLNQTCINAIQNLLQDKKFNPTGVYVFQSKKTFGMKPLTVQRLHSLVKSWCRKIKLKGNYGSHTLRKTFGYHQRVTFHASIEQLMVCFNHSNQRQTLEYLCIQPEEIKKIYMNEL
ncbi:MAG: tyrosine-type recombinase/integrase [Desulfosalsimonadaceae bacterium]